MKWIRPRSIELNNFGPFVGTHTIKLPDSGLILVRGRVAETGGGSGAGKSYLVNAPAFVTGGCPFAATELQSWYTEETPGVKLLMDASDGSMNLERHDGLVIKGGSAGKGVRGKTAETKLDEIFGMDKELRALATHRGQDEPALFLGMPDPKKKEVLTKLLGLNKYEKVAAAAAQAAKDLTKLLDSELGKVEACRARVEEADRALAEVGVPDPLEVARLEEEAGAIDTAAQALATESSAAMERAETVRKTTASALETKLVALRVTAKEIRAEARPSELDELANKITMVRGRIEKVRQYDKAKAMEFERGRTDLRLKLSQLSGKRWTDAVALQAHLATKLAAQRELVGIAKRQKELLAEIEKLQASTCPKCGQEWCDDKSQQELEALIADADSLTQHLVKKPALDKEIENLKFNIANPAPDTETAELEQELAVYGDYQPHQMGPELIAAEKELVAEIDAAQQAWKATQEAKLQELDEQERKLRQAAGRLADASMQEHRNRAGDLANRAAAERNRATAVRASIAALKMKLMTHGERTRALKAANEALENAMASAATTEAKVNLELDVCAAVGREGFLGLIFDDVLAEIAAATNDILKQVANVRHVTFEFSVEREAQNGNVAKLITPMVYSRGRKVSMAPGLSGGMGNAVKLAVDLGFGEVVSRRRGSYPGWLVLDESFNGLDRASKESCMEMLQVYAGDRLVLVVDHATEFQGLFSQIIEVEQVDGRSRIV
jgi:DNA repair exonuclease SbcCD ATPase subunit